ncbi:putative secondary metabolism biosynthetic enzyme [Diaporthe australafricana]|uniref:Secondary metabolism biosynthetic enzyme n=1 Tax=Diaporthe australafricana TaxID=127596 RepID=A0ABR3X9V6_9PEZI
MEVSSEESLNKVQDIITRELGVEEDELQDADVSFSQLGIDPILGRVIVRKISQELGLQLPEDVFQRFRNVGSFRQYIVNSPTPATKTTATATTTTKTTAEEAKTTPQLKTKTYAAIPVLIRGNPTKDSKNMFLLPDGSGSAMAYARLTAPAPNCCLYSMHSPFLGDPGEYTCTVEELSAIWARGIQKIQPHGPYTLGGWSAGGYYAFEVMKYLQSEGEVVDKIILIDSPCRTKFETLPLDVVRYLSSHQLMGDKDTNQIPKWLIDHFEVTLRAVDRYKPTRMSVPVGTAPDAHIIWATDAVLPRGGAAQTGLDCDVKVTRFLLEQRIDLGPNGWETLFSGASRIFIATMPGNHFNIVYKPYVSDEPPLLCFCIHGSKPKVSTVEKGSKV